MERSYRWSLWIFFDHHVPEIWYKVIDEFLDYLKTIDNNLKIHQIKIKFGI